MVEVDRTKYKLNYSWTFLTALNSSLKKYPTNNKAGQWYTKAHNQTKTHGNRVALLNLSVTTLLQKRHDWNNTMFISYLTNFMVYLIQFMMMLCWCRVEDNSHSKWSFGQQPSKTALSPHQYSALLCSAKQLTELTDFRFAIGSNERVIATMKAQVAQISHHIQMVNIGDVPNIYTVNCPHIVISQQKPSTNMNFPLTKKKRRIFSAL